MPVSLTKPVVGVVHVSLFGSAQDDKHRALNCAQASLWQFPGARLAVTAVGAQPAYRNLAAGTRWTVTGYAAA